jgi:hypothetical protein
MKAHPCDEAFDRCQATSGACDLADALIFNLVAKFKEALKAADVAPVVLAARELSAACEAAALAYELHYKALRNAATQTMLVAENPLEALPVN